MEKFTANNYDELLRLFNSNPNRSWHISHFTKDLVNPIGFESFAEIEQAISLLLSDGLIESISHPTAPDHDFKVYSISPSGVRFITMEGGYTKKRRYDSYKKMNIRFTWIRHWVWFISFIISLLVNFYFIITYLIT